MKETDDNANPPTLNGHATPGGEGGLALASAIMQPPMVRSNVAAMMATIDEACAHAAPLTPKVAEAAVVVVAELLAHKSIRMRGWGAKLWDSLSRYNLKRVEVALGEKKQGGVNIQVNGNCALKVIHGLEEGAL